MQFSPASIRRTCRKYEREGVGGIVTEGKRTGRPRLHS